MHISDVVKYHDSVKMRWRQSIQLANEHLKKIEKQSDTKIIEYPEYQEAFNYVDMKCPEVNIKKAKVFLCKSSFLDKLGYKGVGGFYNKHSEIVVIGDKLASCSSSSKSNMWSKIQAKVTTDEIIVHELLHYASAQSGFSKSMEIEEEFAYGLSVEYLRGKGYSDDYIIEHNFLPYLIGVVDAKKIVIQALSEEGYGLEEFGCFSPDKQKRIMKKLEKKVFDITIGKATQMGREIIDIHCPSTINETKVTSGMKKFRLIDL